MRQPFPATRWSMVANAGAEDSGSASALAELCQAYWVPIYGFIRSSGKTRHDAEDLTQGFFARVVECNLFSVAEKSKGKMRTFLLATLKHFLCDEYDRSQAQKRGGNVEVVPMDFHDAESSFEKASSSKCDPARQYDQQWALTMLANTLELLREEYVENGRGTLFQKLYPVLTAQSLDEPYEEIGAELGMTANAVKIVVYRLRQRYRAMLCERIAETVNSTEEVESEITYLCDLFSNSQTQ